MGGHGGEGSAGYEQRTIRTYGSVTIILGEDGPRIDGDVPPVIGMSRDLLAMIETGEGDYARWATAHGPDILLLGHRYQRIGVDGPHVVVLQAIA